MHRLKRLYGAALLAMVSFFLVSNVAFAASTPVVKPPNTTDDCKRTTTSGIQPILQNSDLKVPKVGCGNSPIPNILKVTFGVFSAISLIYILIGAFRYTASGGSSDAVATAKKTIIYAVLGLALSISAFTITSIITRSLG